jgi:hypothetical protein
MGNWREKFWQKVNKKIDKEDMRLMEAGLELVEVNDLMSDIVKEIELKK